MIVVRKEKLQDRLTDLYNSFGMGMNHHAVGSRRSTGRRKPPHIIDLHNAQPKSAVGTHFRVITKSRNRNAVISQELKYGLPFLARDFFPLKPLPFTVKVTSSFSILLSLLKLYSERIDMNRHSYLMISHKRSLGIW